MFRMLATLFKIGLFLGLVGGLSCATKKLMYAAAEASKVGMLDINPYNQRLVGGGGRKGLAR